METVSGTCMHVFFTELKHLKVIHTLLPRWECSDLQPGTYWLYLECFPVSDRPIHTSSSQVSAWTRMFHLFQSTTTTDSSVFALSNMWNNMLQIPAIQNTFEEHTTVILTFNKLTSLTSVWIIFTSFLSCWWRTYS